MSLDILIVEDEMLIAESLKQILLDMGHVDITICRKVALANQNIARFQYDLAILDINIEGDMEGIDLGKKCQDQSIPFFYVTSYSDTDTVLKAKETLPGSYVIKPFSPEEIMVAIELTLMHHKNSEESTDRLIQTINDFHLSKREAEVFTLVLNRLTTAEISDKLYLSQNTVKFHIKNIFQKTNTGGRRELIDQFAV